MAAKSTSQKGNAGMNLVAPPAGLPFPTHANLTAAELLAFFPNYLKCADVVYRLVSNYGSRKAIYTMINTFRDFEVEWSANCCGSMMYKTMKGAGFQGWNLKKHNEWHDENKANWDVNKLDVGGFRAPNTPAQGVSFRSLAVGLRNFPEGDDALDLTRMVRYCAEAPDDAWIYPKDYEKLLNLLGGAKRPTTANTDSAVFERWENRNPPLPIIKFAPLDIEERAPGERTGKMTDVASRKTAATQSSSEAAVGPSTPALAGPSKQPKPERPKKQTRANPVARLEDSDTDSEDWWYSQPYTRQPAEYVEPPGNSSESSAQSILTAFERDGAAGATDPWSTYAFGGPRATAPYRLLRDISQPHRRDTSAWAENLRWEFEQRALFSYDETKRWNESPEHMAQIAHERTTRVWASDELQDSLLD